MLLFIVPVFEGMFDDLGGTLPVPTRVLVFLSNMLKVGFPAVVVGFIAFTITWAKVRHTDRVRNVVDPLKLKLPVFGKLFQKIALARFARNLGTMLRVRRADPAGARHRRRRRPATSCSRGPSGTSRRACAAASRSPGPLAKHSVFPPMVVQMMAVGEDTGALDKMLDKIADFYDQEVEATTEALTALIEPLMIASSAASSGR